MSLRWLPYIFQKQLGKNVVRYYAFTVSIVQDAYPSTKEPQKLRTLCKALHPGRVYASPSFDLHWWMVNPFSCCITFSTTFRREMEGMLTYPLAVQSPCHPISLRSSSGKFATIEDQNLVTYKPYPDIELCTESSDSEVPSC